ncbi:hypothetical protein M758_3G014700 [Ceratodon purpureus]|nr:hypothetical protein M758_3G014700 [Ceratodon purpureus]
MELAVINHPGLGAIMDPIININKLKQPDSPDDGIYPDPKEPIKLPVIVGKPVPVPTPLMGAIRIRMPGGPEVLEYRSVTTPSLKRGEVLIRVTAASVNKYDVMLRKGLIAAAPGDNIYPGLDCAGVIEKLGPGATKWKVGDEVAALLSGGGYATKAVTHEDLCLPIPRGLTASDAASLPEVACSIILSIFTYPGMANNTPRKEPLRVLITGGSTGIGTLAIQFAKAKGCKVYCTTSTEDKAIKCEALGAHIAINYNEQDFADRIWRDTLNTNEPGIELHLATLLEPWTHSMPVYRLMNW